MLQSLRRMISFFNALLEHSRICWLKQSSSSKIKTKYLGLVTFFIHVLKIMMFEWKVNLCFRSVLKTLRLVFLGLIVSLNSLDFCSRPFNVLLSTCFESWIQLLLWQMTYHLCNMQLFVFPKMKGWMSFTYRRKSKRLNTEPCGTPAQCLCFFERTPLYLTLISLPIRKICYPNKNMSLNASIV